MEDKKTYPHSNVTISTEEYRDLIEAAVTGKESSDSYRDRYWTERTNVSNLQKELDAVNAENAALKFQIKEYGKRKPFFRKIVEKIREARSC